MLATARRPHTRSSAPNDYADAPSGNRPEMVTGPVEVLASDPDLADGLEGPRRSQAQTRLLADTAIALAGEWEPQETAARVRSGMGLLVVEGLLVRRVGRVGRFGTELLGPGDLLRPWQHDGEDVMLPFEVSFRVIEHTTFALLDLRFAARAAEYPEVTSALAGRAMQRARTLALYLAIAHYPKTDRRLLLLFWQLAERWGRVTPDGILIRLRLTHQLLADLIAARRPSVSSALGKLSRDGLILHREDGWLLCAGPPDEMTEL